MQAAVEKNLLFWDRLNGLWRIKLDGERVMRGSEGGLNVLRILNGGNGASSSSSSFMTVHCSYQEVLKCRLDSWPVHVTEDGLTIHLWLMDQSLGRRGYRRKFELHFFDDAGASKFFEAYTNALPQSTVRGNGFVDMRYGTGSTSSDEDECPSTDDEERSVDLLRNEGATADDKMKSNDGDRTADDDEIEDLNQRMLEEDQNWGESQSLFHPTNPFEEED